MKLCAYYEGDYCCADMKSHLEDWRIPIDFDSDTNFYFLPFIWPYATRQGLTYCPWCGVKLPEAIYNDLE